MLTPTQPAERIGGRRTAKNFCHQGYHHAPNLFHRLWIVPACRRHGPGKRFLAVAGDLRRSAAAVQHRAAVGLERHAHRRAGRRHAPRSGFPAGQAGLRPSPAGPDDALSLGRMVPAVEGGPRRGRAIGHEPVDLRRELLSVRFRRRLGAGTDARVPRPRAGFSRRKAAPPARPRHAGHLPPDGRRLRKRDRQGPLGRGPAGGPISGGHGGAGRQHSLERQPLLRRSAASGRDGKIPRRHPRGLPPADRRPVRQAGAGLVRR